RVRQRRRVELCVDLGRHQRVVVAEALQHHAARRCMLGLERLGLDCHQLPPFRIIPSCARWSSSMPIEVDWALKSAVLNFVGIALNTFQTYRSVPSGAFIVIVTSSRELYEPPATVSNTFQRSP